MKKAIVLLIALLTFAFVNAQEVTYSIVSSDEEGLTIRVDFPTYSTTDVAIDRTVYQKLSLKGAYAVTRQGVPELLSAAKSVIIPENSQPTVTIVSEDYELVPGFKLLPSRGVIYRNVDPNDVPYTFGPQYQQDRFQLTQAASLTKTFHLRDYNGVTVQTFPFDYNPVREELKVYHSLTLRVNYNAPYTMTTARKNCYEFNEIYKNYFLNYPTSRYTSLTESGEILVIAPESLASAMQPYVDWKIKNGYPTTLVTLTTTGNVGQSVKDYIVSFYQTHNLAFVVIVGDGNLFPYFTIGGETADNYYTEIVGNDNVPDIILGKISAENESQVTAQVNKFIQYEANPLETTHFSKFLGIASSEGPGDENEYDYQHIRNIDNKLLNFTYTDGSELFEGSQGGLDAPGNPTSTMVSNVVNEGVGIINYCGHGNYNKWQTTGFNNNNVDNLMNYNRLPFIFSVACLNGDYVNQTCFAETWLRASKNGQPTGAVGAMMSTMSQPWEPPMCGQDEMIRVLTGADNSHIKRTFGGIGFDGLLKMYENYHDDEGLITMRTWVLFGDPTLQVRTATPQVLAVSHQPSVFVGSAIFQLNCPVENAKAVLTLGNDILAQGVVTNGSLSLPLPTNLLPTDTFHLLVSAFNYIPYQADIPLIMSEQPYITCIGHQINNENGYPQYGETVTATLHVKNVGAVASSDFTVEVSTDDPYVTLLHGSGSFAALQPNETIDLTDIIQFRVKNYVPSGHIAQFVVTFTSDTFVTTNVINQLIHTPQLELGICVVDDSQSGETANGRLDIGETVELCIPIYNTGNAKAMYGFAFVESLNDNIIINSPRSQVTPYVGPDGSAMVKISVTVNPELQGIALAEFKLCWIAGAYKVEKNYQLLIGERIEDWESGDFSMNPWNTNTSRSWFITNENAYEGVYAARSAQIGNNQTSSLKISLQVTQADTLSFYYFVSSEYGGYWGMYDYLAFYINDVEKDAWDGEVNWTKASYAVSPGNYIFEWRYIKDYMSSGGQDMAMLDYIKLPAYAGPVAVVSYEENQIELECYPNPTSDFVVVSCDQIENLTDCRACVYDMNGKLIRQFPLTNNQSSIYIADLNSGVYLLDIMNAQQKMKSVKIIKK